MEVETNWLSEWLTTHNPAVCYQLDSPQYPEPDQAYLIVFHRLPPIMA